MRIIVQFVSDKQLHEITEVYRSLDTDHTGFLTLAGLEQGIRKVDIDMAGDEI